MFKCVKADVDNDSYDVLDTDDFVVETFDGDTLIKYLKKGFIIDDLPASFDGYAPKGQSNSNLTNAKKSKNDEFYTQLSDIEKELSHYDPEIFRDKVIYCPTDVATDEGRILQSQFVKYFILKKQDLKWKKLIATCLAEKGEEFNNKFIMTRNTSEAANPDSDFYNPSITEEDERYYVWDAGVSSPCAEDDFDGGYGSGDFRSQECCKLLEEADIVVTNPPFSLFREFVSWLQKYGKKFIIIGNQNAFKYKEVFPLLRDNKMWLGGQKGVGTLGFEVPDDYEVSESSIKRAKSQYGEEFCERHRMTIVAGTCWFTNVELEKSREPMLLLNKEDWERKGIEYLEYDNFDAINIDKATQIPGNYEGVMGVPITFMYKHCPEQFEIFAVACGNFRANNSELLKQIVGYRMDAGDRGGASLINGKLTYDRILIKKRQLSGISFKCNGKVIRLFCDTGNNSSSSYIASDIKEVASPDSAEGIKGYTFRLNGKLQDSNSPARFNCKLNDLPSDLDLSCIHDKAISVFYEYPNYCVGAKSQDSEEGVERYTFVAEKQMNISVRDDVVYFSSTGKSARYSVVEDKDLI